MRDSMLPARGPGGNKVVIFLLIGGLLILLAAGIILFKQRQSMAPTPVPEPVPQKPMNIPAPLVVSQPAPRPILTEDAGVGTAEMDMTTKKPRKRREQVGRIDAKAVNSFINSRFSQVKTCYEHRLKTNSFLEGKLDLNIGISSTGKVTSVSVNRDTVRDKEMLSCVKRAIRGWAFPKPTGGRVVIAKTFNFKKKSK